MRLALTVLALIFVAGCKSKDTKEETMKAPAAAPAKVESKDAKAAKGSKAAKAAVPATTEAPAAATSASKVECKLKNETRTLEVRSKDKGCETAYTKGGQENVVGSSQNGTAHCEGILNKIKDKLASAGYTCQ
jgi:hypothetical protein